MTAGMCSTGVSKRLFTRTLKSTFVDILCSAVFRLVKQLGHGVVTVSRFMDSAICRLRAARAEESAWSTVWAGVEPQQLQSSSSRISKPRARHTARVEDSYSLDVPWPEQPG